VQWQDPAVVLSIAALSVALLAVLAWLVRGPPEECTVVDVSGQINT